MTELEPTQIQLKNELGADYGVAEVLSKLNHENNGVLGDLRLVVNFCFKVLGLPKITLLQSDICKYIQYGPEGLSWEERNRLIVMAYRGVGKTWISAIFVCFALNINPNWKVLIVSKTKEFAGQVSAFIRKLVDEIDFFKHLSPQYAEVKDKDSEFAFNVTGATPNPQPSVKALGITGQLPGNRADILIPDDIETRENSVTPRKRATVRAAVQEFEAIIKPGGLILCLGTPQVEDSVYTELSTKGYLIRVWPGRYPSKEQLANKTYFNRLADLVRKLWTPQNEWKVSDPLRFTEADMAQRELVLGKRAFNLQYMLDTTGLAAGTYPLQLRDIIVGQFSGLRLPASIGHGYVKLDPETFYTPAINVEKDYFTLPSYISKESDEWANAETVHMFIDPSGKGSDETAYAVIASLKGMLFLVASGGFIEGYTPKTLKNLADICAKFKVNTVDIEDNFGQGMFKNLLLPVLQKVAPNCKILEESFVASRQKEMRICDTLEPLLSQHRLVVLENVIVEDEESAVNSDNESDPSYSLFYQLVRVTRERGCLEHDDRLDALASCAMRFVAQLKQDVEVSEKQLRAELLAKRRKEFLEAEEAWEAIAYRISPSADTQSTPSSTDLLAHLNRK